MHGLSSLFHDRALQRHILLNGGREQIVEWLEWNDPNGVWSDRDSEAEGWKCITLEEARTAMRKAIHESFEEPPTCTAFNPSLPDGADAEICRIWLRQLCRDFGLGFHPDTPAAEYVSPVGQPLPADVVAALDRSIERAFELLGDEVYEVGADEFEKMLHDVSPDHE